MGEQRVGYMALRVSVSGRMNEPKFQKAKAAAEALAEFHGDQVQAEIQEMVPAEWDIFREISLLVQRPLVYIKLTGGDVTKANSGVLDRIVIELFNDVAPLTCENFRCLCSGERGAGLHYQGVP